MKVYNRILGCTILAFIIVFTAANICINNIEKESGKPYRVEAERLKTDILELGFENIDMSKYLFIVQVEKLDSSNEREFFEGGNYDYLIREINGEYYRFEYMTNVGTYQKKMVIVVYFVIGILAILMIMTLIYMKKQLLHPFDQLQNVPYELAKGNLTVPLKENKNRFFGKFLWGMDLLREHLEQQKAEELKLQKEKKTLILSLSHDIKTPLSAIKLYSKALSKNIYGDAEKNCEVAEKINAKADEIETFVSQIIEASGEDFLNLTVENGEFYLAEALKAIQGYYEDKLSLFKTEFTISHYSNYILKGDLERGIEVLQNVMENAIKYGDGDYIHINFAKEEDCCLVTITNSGCTLSENELPHIFDSFWRGSNVKQKDGSGLGLYICRQLMNKMDGEIFAKSTNGIMSVTVLFRIA